MMPPSLSTRGIWWLIQKDLTREIRAQQAWPKTLLLGLVLAFLVATQIDLPVDQQAGAVGGLLWITIFFAATVSIERSFVGEHEDGCWQALQLYPISPSMIFLAKTVVNTATIAILASILIPIFVVLTGVPLVARPGQMALIVILGSVGLAAVGTLISAVTASVRDGGGLLAFLLLPLATPILLSSAEATRLVLAPNVEPLWSWWIQVLAVFAVVFIVVGTLVFDFAMEE
jgi:heme exporter protein CcmB